MELLCDRTNYVASLPSSIHMESLSMENNVRCDEIQVDNKKGRTQNQGHFSPCFFWGNFDEKFQKICKIAKEDFGRRCAATTGMMGITAFLES